VNALDVGSAYHCRPQVRGPKGAGALFVRHGDEHPWLSSRAARRSATVGLEPKMSPVAVGMAVALELAVAERAATAPRMRGLRDSFAATVRSSEGVQETGHPGERLPGIASFVAPGLEGGAVTMALDLGGLACFDGIRLCERIERGQPRAECHGLSGGGGQRSVTLLAGRTTTAAEIAEAAEMVVRTLAHQREAAAVLPRAEDGRAREGARAGDATQIMWGTEAPAGVKGELVAKARVLVAMSGGSTHRCRSARQGRGRRGHRCVDAAERRC